MDIKLTARLSAYSKIDSLNSISNPTVTPEVIDTLFPQNGYSASVTKKDIDNLFIEEESDKVVDKEQIDELFDETTRKVSYTEIDTLFD